MIDKTIDISAVLGSWRGQRRVIRASEMQGRQEKRARRLPVILSDRLAGLLSTRQTIAQLAVSTGEKKERIRHALHNLQSDGRARRTGKRGPGKGAPEYWVAVEVPA